MDGHQRLDALAERYVGELGVTRGRMFASEALKVNNKIFAFVGNDERLIVKIPADLVPTLVAGGVVTQASLGRRTMREWVAVPLSAEYEVWASLMAESFAYVSALSDQSDGPP